MEAKKPTMQEFEYQPNGLIHVPTGATWTTFPSRTELRSYRPSKLGMVLSNGDFYYESEVRGLAQRLMQTPPPQPRENEEMMERRGRRGGRGGAVSSRRGTTLLASVRNNNGGDNG